MTLTLSVIRAAEPLDRRYVLSDGHGLSLHVMPDGSKRWRFRYRFAGRANMISLGLLVDVPLDTARKLAADARDLLSQGIDPSAHRQMEKAALKLTFESAARQWLSDREALLQKGAIVAPTFRKQHQILERYVFLALGSRPLKLITAQELLITLKAIESKGLGETAHRAKRACWRIFNFAEIRDLLDHNPVEALHGALEPLRPRHHAGITDPRRLGALLRALRGYRGSRRVWCALQLLPLLFVRPSELRLADWSEFDLDNAVWRIPANRTKMRKQHLVPLSQQAVALLKQLRAPSPDRPRLFPSSKNPQSAISAQSFAAALRKLGYRSSEQTPHGFRTTASTLLRELGWNPDVVERQLAHLDTNKLRRIYNHAEYLDFRRRMMQAWADYLDRLRDGRSRQQRQSLRPAGPGTVFRTNATRPVIQNANSETPILEGASAMVLTERMARLALPRSSPYKLPDGRGLYLHVGVSGGKHWHYRYRLGGRDTTMSLGTYPHVSLDEARVRRLSAEKAVQYEIDPQAQKSPSHKSMPTFRQVGRAWLAQLLRRVRARRRSIKTFRKSKALLVRWAFPTLGHRPIDSIQPQDVSALILRIQAMELHETAHRVLSQCGRVFRYGIGRGLLQRDVTRDLRGSLEAVPVIHHAAITDPHRVARLLRDINRYQGNETTRIALQLAPLLFARPGELRKARWEEFDEQSAQWRIPAQRMKARIIHLVPLSAQALARIGRLRQLTGHTEFLFPAKTDANRCMSDNTINKALRAMGYRHEQMTAHGFRTLASTLLSEHGWPEEVVERQLAHIDRNKVRAAYNHAQHLPLRAVMMQAWADYLDNLQANAFSTQVLNFQGWIPDIAQCREAMLTRPPWNHAP